MNKILDFLASTYLGGFTDIVIGILVLVFTIRTPMPKNDFLGGNVKGIAAGIGIILMGTTVIIAKLMGKL